jgi:mono/diheme cytochrome c family protein
MEDHTRTKSLNLHMRRFQWRHRTAVCLVVAFLAAAVSGCRSPRRGEAAGAPLHVSSPAIEHGRATFQQHCYRCHPGGEGGLGPSLNEKPLPVFLMKTQVRHGLGSMPGFNKDEISPHEMDDLMAYMLALRRAR